MVSIKVPRHEDCSTDKFKGAFRDVFFKCFLQATKRLTFKLLHFLCLPQPLIQSLCLCCKNVDYLLAWLSLHLMGIPLSTQPIWPDAWWSSLRKKSFIKKIITKIKLFPACISGLLTWVIMPRVEKIKNDSGWNSTKLESVLIKVIILFNLYNISGR